MFEKYIRQMHLDSSLMKEKFVMERYSTYLNKCMFMGADEYLRNKFKAFIEKKHPKQGQNFFQRMQRDQQAR